MNESKFKSTVTAIGNTVRSVVNGVVDKVREWNDRIVAFCTLSFLFTLNMLAQSSSTGVSAIEGVAPDITKYVPAVQKLLYAIAGVVALGGAISVFIKMNNEDQDIKKSIMLIIGACIFLIAAATALPAFFGINS